jgi:enoyl-CoA hydratase/carnithine racemase
MHKCSYSVEDKFATITFFNDGKFNPELLEEFNRYLDETIANETIQALIITGSDKNFCQGLDLEAISAMEGLQASDFVDACMRAVGRLLVFPQPVVSAVNGHAFGLGAMITLASDYSVMREDKGFFCLPEIDIQMNLIPSMNALVCNKLQGKILRDVLLTGKRVGGIEARELAIVDASGSEKELLNIAKQLPVNMMGKNRSVLSQLKTGINQGILPEQFEKN